MKLQHLLLKVGLIDLTAVRMRDLIAESDRSMIQWAFENGRYDVRLMAVEFFTVTKDLDSMTFLKKAVDDETEIISQAAMSGLDDFSGSQEIQQMITEKRQFWIDENKYREGRRNRSHRKTSVLAESKERGSKETLDNVRNMLKKPMLGGKWF